MIAVGGCMYNHNQQKKVRVADCEKCALWFTNKYEFLLYTFSPIKWRFKQPSKPKLAFLNISLFWYKFEVWIIKQY